MLLSATPSFDSSIPYSSYYLPPSHLATLRFWRGQGPTVRKASNLSRTSSRFSRLRGGDYQSMGKGSDAKYNSYFAKSPGQRPNGSSQAKPTDKTHHSSSSRSSSDKSSSSVDSSGKLPKRDLPSGSTKSSSLKVNTNSALQTLSRIPLHPPRKYRDYDTTSDYGSDESSSTLDSPKSYASTATSLSSIPENLLNRKKQELVGKVMTHFYAYFYPWIEATFGIECYDDGDNGRGSGGGAGSRCTDSHDGSGSSRKSSAGKKRQQREDSDDGEDDEFDDDGDGDKDDRKNSKRARRDSGNRRKGPRFACPFFKNDPEQHRERTCCGPGWEADDIHRLKEHLYRKHSQPSHACFRCLREFKTDKELGNHLRLETVCTVKHREEEDTRLSKEQVKQLKAKFKGGLSPRQKWEFIYKIVFPNESLPASPYHDGPIDAATEYGEFLYREYPPMFEREVEKVIEQHMGDVGRKVISRMASILPTLNRGILEKWKDFKGDGQQQPRAKLATPTPGDRHLQLPPVFLPEGLLTSGFDPSFEASSGTYGDQFPMTSQYANEITCDYLAGQFPNGLDGLFTFGNGDVDSGYDSALHAGPGSLS